MARGCRAPLAQTVLKNKEGETSLTACHCQRSSGAPHAGKNSTHLTAVHPKSLRCQQLRDTLASAPRSHPRGTLRGPGLHLRSCRARNPSQGPPAAHAALKSVPLAAAKTIREAASPRTNPGCVIVPHRRGSAAPAQPRRRAGRVLASLLRRSRLSRSRAFGAKEQRSVTAGDTAQPTGRQALLAACTGTSVASPEVFPPGTAAAASRSAGSINILPPDSTLSSNCFASNRDQTQCLPKLRYKCQQEAQQHKHNVRAQQR